MQWRLLVVRCTARDTPAQSWQSWQRHVSPRRHVAKWRQLLLLLLAAVDWLFVVSQSMNDHVTVSIDVLPVTVTWREANYSWLIRRQWSHVTSTMQHDARQQLQLAYCMTTDHYWPFTDHGPFTDHWPHDHWPLTIHWPLTTIDHSLTTDHWPLTIDHSLTSNYWPLTTHWPLITTDHWPFTDHGPFTDHWPHDHWPLTIHWPLTTDIHSSVTTDYWLFTDHWPLLTMHWPLTFDQWPFTDHSLTTDHCVNNDIKLLQSSRHRRVTLTSSTRGLRFRYFSSNNLLICWCTSRVDWSVQ